METENASNRSRFETIKKSKTKPVLVFLFLLVSLIVLSFFSVNWYKSQAIKNVKISGNSILSNLEISELIEKDIANSSVDGIDLLQVEHKLQQHDYISTAKVWFNSKGILGIDVKERYPVAIVVDNLNRLSFVDNEANLLPYRFHKEFSNLPIISNVFNNSKINKSAITGALLIVDELESNKYNLKNFISEIIYVSNNIGYKLFLSDPALPIIFGKTNDISNKLDKLHIFWKNKLLASSFDNSIKGLDIRWQDIVIVQQ